MADNKKLLTVEIPVSLHRAAKLAALKRGITLREMVIKGLQTQVKGGRA
jgi:predicted HicB family RNase H-like nuclease